MANDNEYISASLWHNLPDDLPYKGSVKRVLLQAKAENVAPIIYGEWIYHPYLDPKNLMIECSNCNTMFTLGDKQFYYCPHCGSDMRGGIKHG